MNNQCKQTKFTLLTKSDRYYQSTSSTSNYLETLRSMA